MGFLKNALSTRRAMQKTPSIEGIHDLSDQELHQLQDCFLEMLKDLDRVCREYNICYMAAGGTALGSVRHGGFIPWDDDVDVLMPREDLNRFAEIFEEAMGDKYEFTTPNSKYPIESMISAIYKKNTLKPNIQTVDTGLPQGIHIDIFAIESVPRNPVVRRIKGTVALGLQYIAVSALFRHYTSPRKKQLFYETPAGKFNYRLRMTVGTLFAFRSYDKWGNLFDRFVRGKKDTGLWAVPTDVGHYFGHIMPKEVYYPPIRGKFEDMEIAMPHDPDAYLKNQYGDYMWIPPVEDREKHWAFELSFDTTKK